MNRLLQSSGKSSEESVSWLWPVNTCEVRRALEGVSTFRIVLQKSFDDADAQRSCARVFIRVVNGG